MRGRGTPRPRRTSTGPRWAARRSRNHTALPRALIRAPLQWVAIRITFGTGSYRSAVGHGRHAVGYFAAAQLGPKPMSTTSGTRSSITRLHRRRARRLDRVALGDRHLEDQLVVHGEDHAGREAGVVERPVEVDHRELEDVGRRALHRRVLRHALAHLADAEVVGRRARRSGAGGRGSWWCSRAPAPRDGALHELGTFGKDSK